MTTNVGLPGTVDTSGTRVTEDDDKKGGRAHIVLERMRDRRLVEAVRSLRPDQQECLVLRFFQNLSLAQTAQATDAARAPSSSSSCGRVGRLAALLGELP